MLLSRKRRALSLQYSYGEFLVVSELESVKEESKEERRKDEHHRYNIASDIRIKRSLYVW